MKLSKKGVSKLSSIAILIHRALNRSKAGKIEAKAFWRFEVLNKRTLSKARYKDRREAFFHGFWAGHKAATKRKPHSYS